MGNWLKYWSIHWCIGKFGCVIINLFAIICIFIFVVPFNKNTNKKVCNSWNKIHLQLVFIRELLHHTLGTHLIVSLCYAKVSRGKWLWHKHSKGCCGPLHGWQQVARLSLALANTWEMKFDTATTSNTMIRLLLVQCHWCLEIHSKTNIITLQHKSNACYFRNNFKPDHLSPN